MTRLIFIGNGKAVRRVWGIPNCTHCHLLPGVSNDRDIESQLLSRSLNFIRSSLKSNNRLLNICARLVLRSSGSTVSNTLSVMSQKTNVSRSQLCFSDILYFHPPQSMPLHASTIRDFAIGCSRASYDDLKNYRDIIYELAVN